MQNGEKMSAYVGMIGELSEKLTNLVQEPKADVQKNIRALLTESIARMDLVTQDELARYKQALSQAQVRVSDLENRLVELECLCVVRDSQSR